jgi:hypothetical protein
MPVSAVRQPVQFGAYDYHFSLHWTKVYSFLYGPRFAGLASAASMSFTISPISQSVLLTTRYPETGGPPLWLAPGISARNRRNGRAHPRSGRNRAGKRTLSRGRRFHFDRGLKSMNVVRAQTRRVEFRTARNDFNSLYDLGSRIRTSANRLTYNACILTTTPFLPRSLDDLERPARRRKAPARPPASPTGARGARR